MCGYFFFHYILNIIYSLYHTVLNFDLQKCGLFVGYAVYVANVCYDDEFLNYPGN